MMLLGLKNCLVNSLSIYWYRCDICGRNAPTTYVEFNGRKLRVCYRCSIILEKWSYKGEPAWNVPVREETAEKELNRKIKSIEDMLEGKKE